MKDKMTGRTKCRAIENDKRERKEYIKESNSGTIKDIVKITSHMQEVKANYGRKGPDNRCPICQSEENNTDHVLRCNKGYKKFNLNDERGTK